MDGVGCRFMAASKILGEETAGDATAAGSGAGAKGER